MTTMVRTNLIKPPQYIMPACFIEEELPGSRFRSYSEAYVSKHEKAVAAPGVNPLVMIAC